MSALEKEVDFMKINEKLDAETESLFKQLSDVRKLKIQSEDGLIDAQASYDTNQDNQKTSPSDGLGMLPDGKKQKGEKTSASLATPCIGGNIAQPPRLLRHKSEVRIRDRLDNNLVPESIKSTGQDGILRYLKAKIQVLAEQLETVQKDEKKLVEKIKDIQGEKERLVEDRDRWIQQANSAKSLLVKHEQHVSDIVMQLQSAQAENGYLKKEVEKIKKELKQTSQTAGSNEVRLNRANDELEKLKVSLRQAKQEEKDCRESQKKKIDDLTCSLKRIEKQKIELLHAFKKQLTVIDGLKKQRGLAEAGKLLKNIEEDFLEFLDWSPQKP